jgi:hypothetical protein
MKISKDATVQAQAQQFSRRKEAMDEKESGKRRGQEVGLCRM